MRLKVDPCESSARLHPFADHAAGEEGSRCHHGILPQNTILENGAIANNGFGPDRASPLQAGGGSDMGACRNRRGPILARIRELKPSGLEKRMRCKVGVPCPEIKPEPLIHKVPSDPCSGPDQIQVDGNDGNDLSGGDVPENLRGEDRDAGEQK